MSHRMEIELTSARDDGTFTWRAAGARQPKGVIEAALAGSGAKVGDILRVEAEVEIDGITILSVLPSKDKKDAPAGRIELLAPAKITPGVTTTLVSEGGRGRRDRGDLLDSRRRPDRPGGRERRPPRDPNAPREQRGDDRGAAGRPGGRPTGRPGARDDTKTDRRPERRPRPEGAVAPHDPARSGGRSDRPHGDGRPGSGRPAGREAPPRRTPPRFEPGTKHRDELFASLPPEQQPVAERLAVGGLPAVRKAVAEERSRARAEGRPETSGDAVLALAEQLQPAVKQAVWLDRAEAAVAQLDKISLRELRTTVAAAAPRDDEGRELARRLREELDRRVAKLRATWETNMTHALDEGRVLQALRLSAQPPEPTARFPAALVASLSTKVGAAMTTDTPPERWLAMLAAALVSPIRRQIHPAGIPQDPTGAVLREARLAAGSLPALAPMLGLTMPPPPKPIRTNRPARPDGPRPGRAARPTVRRQPRTESPAQGSIDGSLPAAEVAPAPDGPAAAAPPEPELAGAQPEPELAAVPPEPELAAAPPEPELAAAPAEPELAAAPPEPELAASPPEPELAPAPPKPEPLPPPLATEVTPVAEDVEADAAPGPVATA